MPATPGRRGLPLPLVRFTIEADVELLREPAVTDLERREALIP
jgi:hypothetical protein